jgi:hypothetical protein
MAKIIKIKGCRNTNHKETETIKLVNQETYFINADYIYELKKFSNCTKVILDANTIGSYVVPLGYTYIDNPDARPFVKVNSLTDFIITETSIESLIELINGDIKKVNKPKK